MTLSPAAREDDAEAARTSQNNVAVTSGNATNAAMKHMRQAYAAEEQYVRQIETHPRPTKSLPRASRLGRDRRSTKCAGQRPADRSALSALARRVEALRDRPFPLPIAARQDGGHVDPISRIQTFRNPRGSRDEVLRSEPRGSPL